MDPRGKRFLVVGGAGFIGSHLVEELTRIDVKEIIVYDNLCRGSEENLAQALRDPRVTFFETGADILHRDMLDKAMRGVDGVFHLAALWLLHCQEYPRSAFDVNIGGTFNVFESAMANNVSRIVYSSSASVYGDALQEPMTEEHPHNNQNFYGATKIAGENMLRALYFMRAKSPAPFTYAGLRYMNVYGPRQDYRGAYIAVIMKMLDRIDKGLPPVIYGDGSQAYDFIYVGDCAKANVLAMAADAREGFYNVGTGIKTSLKQLAFMVLEAAGSDLKPQFEPAGVTFVKNRVGCPAKAERELSFKASMPLLEGLRNLVNWRKDHIERSALKTGKNKA
ncbi:MAG: NAD-dependent epimerase/dehydratase family protein [Thermodesulfobacteriota bacterium]